MIKTPTTNCLWPPHTHVHLHAHVCPHIYMDTCSMHTQGFFYTWGLSILRVWAWFPMGNFADMFQQEPYITFWWPSDDISRVSKKCYSLSLITEIVGWLQRCPGWAYNLIR